MPKCYAFFCSIHFCFSVAAQPGNTICCSVMAEAALAVFPSHSEIGRTRCTMRKIIFVRLQSSFAIPSASNLCLIFGMFAYIKQALRLCPLLAVQSCTQFPPSCSKGVLLLTSTRKFGLAVSTEVGIQGGLVTSSSGGTMALFSQLEG